VVESDQNVVFKIFRVKNLTTEAVSLTAIVAAINSKRGVVAFFSAIRDLALNSLTFTPFSCSIRAKIAATYAKTLASQNVCNVSLPLPNFRGI